MQFRLPYDLFTFAKVPSFSSDKFGLFHSVSHLYKMRRKILFLPIEKQSWYADQGLINAVKANDKMVYDSIMKERGEFGGIKSYNTVSIGNVAFVALHCIEEKVRDRARMLLGMYVAKIINEKFKFSNGS